MSDFAAGRSVEVPEIPFADDVFLPADESAVVIVDMQNDFVKEGGSLVCSAAAATIEPLQKLLEAARRREVRVVYTQDTHFEGDPEWRIWPEHCRAGSWGWQIIDELKPESQDLICPKNRYDGFYGTWLDHFLTACWGVKHLVIGGTVANICVLHTAASAGLRWYHIVVPAEGISALTEFDQACALRQISWLYQGDVVRSTDDIRFQ